MRIEGLPPAMLQALLSTASPKIERAAGTLTAPPEVLPAPAPVPPASLPATSVQMLVAMAAMEPPSERRRKVAEEMGRGLSLLERLHAELAEGVAAPERLRELAAGRTVVLITHRMASVREADRIYVLDHGAVVEEGRHEELMGAGGIYAQLFSLQASAYQPAA